MGSEKLEFGIILGDGLVGEDVREQWNSIRKQAEIAQRHGFSYICLGQHFLYRTYRWLQPIPLLARLAAETDAHVRLVPSVLIVPFYHPVVLAEELATLDVVTDGRLVVGAGAGYLEREFDLLGVPFAQRFARLEESLEVMSRLWAEPVVAHRGRFWQFEDATPHVQPLQRPRPPLWLGAMGPAGIRRAARLADAWMCTPETSFDELHAGLRLFDAERARLGRPPARIPVRREIVLGTSTGEALERYRLRSQPRYLAYAERGHKVLSGQRVDVGFERWAAERAICGTAEECVTRLRDLDARLSPVVIRPSWPGMSADDVTRSLDEVGAQVVAPLRA